MSPRSISRPVSPAVGRTATIVLSLAVATAGGFHLHDLMGKASRARSMRQWPRVPAIVVSSDMVERRQDRQTEFSIAIVYSYSYEGGQYRASDWGAEPPRSTFRDGGEWYRKRYAPGSALSCYVDPEHPERAVINPEPGPDTSDFLLAVLAFIAIPSYLLVGALRTRGGEAATAAIDAGTTASGNVTPPSAGAGPVHIPRPLPPRPGLVGSRRFLGIGAAAAFAVFVAGAWGDWPQAAVVAAVVAAGAGPWSMAKLLSGWQMMPVVTLDRSSVRLGGALSMHWALSGGGFEPRRLTIELVGQERAVQASHDNDGHTWLHDFLTITVVDTNAPDSIRAGRATVSVPAGTMHSFEAGHNAIAWEVRVRTFRRGLPGLGQTIDVIVEPVALQSRERA